jgi:hypothetical protein
MIAPILEWHIDLGPFLLQKLSPFICKPYIQSAIQGENQPYYSNWIWDI